MNKKVKNIILVILLSITTFFSFNNILFAKTGQIHPHSNTNYKNAVYRMNGVNKDKNIGWVGIYNINGQHAYCIELGTPLSPGYDPNNNVDFNDYSYGFFKNLSASERAARSTRIAYILTFAENIGTVPAESAMNKTQALRIYAAQGLIWETMTGERTSFNNLWPENHHGTACSFYDVVHSRNGCNKGNDMSVIAQEYDRIVKAVQSTFLDNNPGEANKTFKPGGSENKVALSWDGSKYTLRINDYNFAYWEIIKTDGLQVEKGSNYITISSKNPIDEKSAKQVGIQIINKNNSSNVAKAYYHDDLQDLTTIVGTTLQRYIKVYTPKYQLKITKKASLDGKVLSGAKFNICSNSSCTKILGTVTTDKNGEAVFKKLPSPGTYYVKEIVAPPGYELNSKPIAVPVSSSDIEGSSNYGTPDRPILDTNKVFNLTKKTVDENGNVIDLDDGCGTDNYTGPEFEIKENGSSLYFKEIKPGEYDVSSKDADGATTKLRTCKGKFKVYTLPKCNYTISETKAPEGLTLPSEPTKAINVCGSGKNVSFTNGFAGLEFQKKDEDGNFVEGGKFSLQRRVNNVYRDILLKQVEDGSYVYDANLKEEDEGATYIILTNKGIARISKLAPGEYRVVEKEAPEGFELIQDKDSKSLVTIKDSDKEGYYLVEMIDQKVRKNGSKSSAELVVTITTGRKVPNYILIISALVVMLVIAILIRKKIKK